MPKIVYQIMSLAMLLVAAALFVISCLELVEYFQGRSIPEKMICTVEANGNALVCIKERPSK